MTLELAGGLLAYLLLMGVVGDRFLRRAAWPTRWPAAAIRVWATMGWTCATTVIAVLVVISHDVLELILMWAVHAGKSELHLAYGGPGAADPAWNIASLVAVGLVVAGVSVLAGELARMSRVRARLRAAGRHGRSLWVSGHRVTVVRGEGPAAFCVPGGRARRASAPGGDRPEAHRPEGHRPEGHRTEGHRTEGHRTGGGRSDSCAHVGPGDGPNGHPGSHPGRHRGVVNGGRGHRGGLIVVAERFSAALSADELSAAVEHEASHLMRRHHRWILAGDVLGRMLALAGLMRSMSGQIRLLAELEADDHAAAQVGTRPLARALLLAAELDTSLSRRSPDGALGLGADLAGPRVRRLVAALSAESARAHPDPSQAGRRADSVQSGEFGLDQTGSPTATAGARVPGVSWATNSAGLLSVHTVVKVGGTAVASVMVAAPAVAIFLPGVLLGGSGH